MIEYSYKNRFNYLRDIYLSRIKKEVEDDKWFIIDGKCLDTYNLVHQIFVAEKKRTGIYNFMLTRTDVYNFIKLHFPKHFREPFNDPTHSYEDEPELNHDQNNEDNDNSEFYLNGLPRFFCGL